MKKSFRPTVNHHRVNKGAGNDAINKATRDDKRKRVATPSRKDSQDGVSNRWHMFYFRSTMEDGNTEISKWQGASRDRRAILIIVLKTTSGQIFVEDAGLRRARLLAWNAAIVFKEMFDISSINFGSLQKDQDVIDILEMSRNFLWTVMKRELTAKSSYWIRDSSAKQKRRGDKGSPCRTPLEQLK